LEDLRGILLATLPGALKRYGPTPESLVEDAVQEALVRVLDRLDTFEGRSRFTTWATTITVRTVLTELRRLHWKDRSLDTLLAGGTFTAEVIADPGASPETQSGRFAILEALRAVIEDELSERQRIAILAEMQGLPQEEIGRRLGINRNAVYKLGHDARKKLKRELEALGFDAAAIRAAFT
jgi:RNA polymerase sigma-70 factor (ECF subfamily)